jgi:hypothetical protein
MINNSDAVHRKMSDPHVHDQPGPVRVRQPNKNDGTGGCYNSKTHMVQILNRVILIQYQLLTD